jgi:hypothetical protein
MASAQDGRQSPIHSLILGVIERADLPRFLFPFLPASLYNKGIDSAAMLVFVTENRWWSMIGRRQPAIPEHLAGAVRL